MLLNTKSGRKMGGHNVTVSGRDLAECLNKMFASCDSAILADGRIIVSPKGWGMLQLVSAGTKIEKENTYLYLRFE